MFLNAADVHAGSSASFERPIDLVHLARQTLGDRDLEREILDLFVMQTKTVLAQLSAVAAEKARMDLAHTLKGAARAVGAWQVAASAEACEFAIDGSHESWVSAMEGLGRAVRQAHVAIAELRAEG